MSYPKKEDVIQTYRKRAGNYDLSANLYYLMGYREQRYRRRAVGALRLNKGDTVLELGCGTGLNFPLLQEKVGPEGRIIGVDLTDAMLERAQERVRDQGWTNVQLHKDDMSRFEFPHGLNGAISTFALSLVPEPRRVIRNCARALAPAGRLAILDLKMPSNWLSIFTPLVILIERPFGVTRQLARERPWEKIQKAMDEALVEVLHNDLFGGFSFLSCGAKLDQSAEAVTVSYASAGA